MAFYVDEEEVWKCPEHPSKRRRSGICPVCLRDRLSTLCPDCANIRPCACSANSATKSSSSSSSSRFSSYEAGRVSNLVESQPVFRRSRSLAIPFLRSRTRFVGNENELKEPPSGVSKGKASSFWSVFRSQKNKKVEVNEGNTRKGEEPEEDKDNVRSRTTMMMRSRSVAVSVTSDSGNGVGVREYGRAKSRSWYFPSPMKVFRQSKMTKVVQERSPLYRA
ncbi:uncharacterized protein LOC121237094 [Juglans microcarpa x Juglans regia]|uniref:uncharacterized protein LOC121237094 n=1 Tax=Juglans microcarpa x Juglans regia TaxID=2249226 RepID=UPI001B7E0133|nr:uncharacterized protein LOC121237094 [Juglans microcarpa x Juglans regia]